MTQPSTIVANDEPECIDLTDDGDSPSTSETTERALKRPLTNSSVDASSSRVTSSSTSPHESDYNSSSASPSLIVLDSPPSRPGTEPNDPGPSASSLPYRCEPPMKRFAPDIVGSSSASTSGSTSINNQQYLPPPPLPHIMNDPRADISMMNSVPSSVSTIDNSSNWFQSMNDPQATWTAINQLTYPSSATQYLGEFTNPQATMLPSYLEDHVAAGLQELYNRCFDPTTNFNNNT